MCVVAKEEAVFFLDGIDGRDRDREETDAIFHIRVPPSPPPMCERTHDTYGAI